jgi:tetratricopeptide (TPR) repeat protein
MMNALHRANRPASFGVILAVSALIWMAGFATGQAPAAPPASNPDQNQQQPRQKPPTQSNPFPDDTGNVPVLPNGKEPVPREAPRETPAETAPALPGADVDPVRSPDEPLPDVSSSSTSGESSSSSDLGRILEPPPDDERRKLTKGKNQAPAEHAETAKEDESVGEYYLERKNWRAALSRFQSALVLDPENPEVYWGLAEAQRHLGDLAGAKANYTKLVEYDPDSKHAKEAKKLLNEPEMAKAPAPASHP